MPITTEFVDLKLTIKLPSRLDQETHQQFVAAYTEQSIKPVGYIVDMAEVIFFDSSSLGMLLLLRKFAGGDKASVSIINLSPTVNKILRISRFDRLFELR